MRDGEEMKKNWLNKKKIPHSRRYVYLGMCVCVRVCPTRVWSGTVRVRAHSARVCVCVNRDRPPRPLPYTTQARGGTEPVSAAEPRSRNEIETKLNQLIGTTTEIMITSPTFLTWKLRTSFAGDGRTTVAATMLNDHEDPLLTVATKPTVHVLIPCIIITIRL